MKQLVLLPIVLSASVAWGGSGDEKVLRELGPDKRLGLCECRVRGIAGSNTAWAFGIVGAIYDAKKKAHDAPYAEEVAKEIRRIYQEMLSGTGAFQTIPLESLRGTANGRDLPLREAVAANELFACISADSAIGVTVGWKKKLSAKTEWQILGSAGWKIEIETEVVPDSAQSMFPDTADPKLKPVLLQLARDSATQFLEQLSKEMKDAGSRAEVTIVDAAEVPLGTLLDPGTFPQPEPECALNSNGKWEKRVALGNGVDLALVYIPTGSFFMGSVADVNDEPSHPQHQVTMGRAYWIGMFEVTQAQWKAVMGTNPSKFKGDDLPVDNVSWNDSVTFLGTLNQRLGRGKETAFRLPVEAEWEYACRTGTTTNYSFSDSRWNLAKYAWFVDNSSSTTHPVGQLRPNPWGVFDMYGNVAEWCEDAWHPSYQGAPADDTVWGGRDEDRVQRGGHWEKSSSELRSYRRDNLEAKERSNTGGFRLVLPALHPETVLPPPAAPDTAVATPEPTTSAGTPAGSSTSAPTALPPPQGTNR